MNPESHLALTQLRRRVTQWFFTLTFIESIYVPAWLVRLSIDQHHSILPKLTSLRFLFLLLTLILAVVLAWIAIRFWRYPTYCDRFILRLTPYLERDRFYNLIVITSGILLGAGIYTLLIGSKITDQFLKAYIDRLFPFTLWATILSVQVPLALRLFRYGSDIQAFKPFRKTFLVSLLVYGLLLITAIAIYWTRIGLTPDPVGWGDPGIPILPLQIFIAICISVAILILGFLIDHLLKISRKLRTFKPSPILLDLLVFILLWAIAIWRWQAEPMRPNYFAPAPVPPNFEYYPYSDAAIYDLSAQNLLVGNGLGNNAVRPFYSYFLAIIQAIHGIGYPNAIVYQVIFLALIPPLLFLLIKELHHPLSGILVALLAIFHESNTIALSGIVDVSHSKLMMSDLPATLGVIFFTWAVVLGIKKTTKRVILLVIAGGTLAILMLVRLQVVMLLPATLFLFWFVYPSQPVRWIKHILLLIAIFATVLTPWLFRNWQKTGKITLTEASREAQVSLIGQRYSLSLQGEARLTGETDEQYTSRTTGSIFTFVRQHPIETARFITNHYLHNEVATLLVLPASFPLAENVKTFLAKLPHSTIPPAKLWSMCCSLRAYIDKLGYWTAWNGTLLKESVLPILINLLLISIGLGITWKNNRLAGITPLVFMLGYSLSNAIARNSARRYNLPVDWVGYIYYAIGLTQLLFWAATFFSNRVIPEKTNEPGDESRTEDNRLPWKQVVTIGFAFFLLSASLPIVEKVVPVRYKNSDSQMIISTLDNRGLLSSLGLDKEHLQSFLKKDQAIALIGRDLYPRYYEAGQGEPSKEWQVYAPKDYNRLGFYLVGPENWPVLLRLQTAPDYFPNARDTFIIGCYKGGYVEAYLVALLDPIPKIILSSQAPAWDCSTK
jgi:hypothetical protein